MSLRDELPTSVLTFSIKHKENEDLRAEVDAYLAAGGKIDVIPVHRVVSDVSPIVREKMLESSQRGNEASAVSRANYGKTERTKIDPLEGGLYASKKDAARILGLKEPYFYSSYRMGTIVIPVAKTYKNSEYFLTSDVYKVKKDREDGKVT